MPLTRKTPIGTVHAFAGATAPSGYLICDGSPVSRTTYSALFAIIGTAHGTGDGSTTFNLPDYRGTFLRGAVATSLDSIAGSGTAASNQATFTNHNVNRTGFKVKVASGALSGLSVGSVYYAIVVDNNTLAFATSLANALSNTRIAISGANSAVLAQYEDPDSSSRYQSTVGSSSTGAGTRQDPQLDAHRHAVWGNRNDGATTRPGIGANGTQVFVSNGTLSDMTGAMDNTGGNETRPKNITVNYIIAY